MVIVSTFSLSPPVHRIIFPQMALHIGWLVWKQYFRFCCKVSMIALFKNEMGIFCEKWPVSMDIHNLGMYLTLLSPFMKYTDVCLAYLLGCL
jgi:hypothetical protein